MDNQKQISIIIQKYHADLEKLQDQIKQIDVMLNSNLYEKTEEANRSLQKEKQRNREEIFKRQKQIAFLEELLYTIKLNQILGTEEYCNPYLYYAKKKKSLIKEARKLRTPFSHTEKKALQVLYNQVNHLKASNFLKILLADLKNPEFRKELVNLNWTVEDTYLVNDLVNASLLFNETNGIFINYKAFRKKYQKILDVSEIFSLRKSIICALQTFKTKVKNSVLIEFATGLEKEITNKLENNAITLEEIRSETNVFLKQLKKIIESTSTLEEIRKSAKKENKQKFIVLENAKKNPYALQEMYLKDEGILKKPEEIQNLFSMMRYKATFFEIFLESMPNDEELLDKNPDLKRDLSFAIELKEFLKTILITEQALQDFQNFCDRMKNTVNYQLFIELSEKDAKAKERFSTLVQKASLQEEKTLRNANSLNRYKLRKLQEDLKICKMSLVENEEAIKSCAFIHLINLSLFNIQEQANYRVIYSIDGYKTQLEQKLKIVNYILNTSYQAYYKYLKSYNKYLEHLEDIEVFQTLKTEEKLQRIEAILLHITYLEKLKTFKIELDNYIYCDKEFAEDYVSCIKKEKKKTQAQN